MKFLSPDAKVEEPSTQARLYIRQVPSWHAAEEELAYFDESWIFRGQCDATWGLRCYLDRGRGTADPIDAEAELRRNFMQRAHLYLPTSREPETVLEWLALIQHHGGPTRLIDFTRSPLVAAFFALSEETAAETSAIWAINEWGCHRRAVKRIREVDSEYSWLQEHHAIDRAIEARLLTRPPTRFVAPVQPSRLNARMVLQQGLFICLGDPGTDVLGNLNPEVSDEDPLQIVKIELPHGARNEALHSLRRMNISRETLFPGLDGLAQSLAHLLVPRNMEREALLRELGKPNGWPAGDVTPI
jgi:hypothetical protein